MKYFYLIIILLSNSISNAQNLSELLWSLTESCNESSLEPYIELGIERPTNLKDYCSDCIDDAKNGYLLIKGSWPTCGCGCEVEVGAYKNSNGKYSILSFNTWTCEQTSFLNSNVPIDSILPSHLSLKTFAPKSTFDSVSYFYLNVKIPRVGTDTKSTIKMYPIGMVGKGNDGLAIKEHSPKLISRNLKYIIDALSEYELHLFLYNELYEIDKKIKDKVISKISTREDNLTLEKFTEYLKYIESIYNQYNQLEYTQIIMSWNRLTGRFEIKEKLSPPKKMSLESFIKESEFYSPNC